MNLKNVLFAAKRGAVKHSPTILLVMGIGGMLTSVIWAAKATPKAMKAIEKAQEVKSQTEEFKDCAVKPALTAGETVKATWRCYLPSAVIFMVSATCLIFGHTVSAKRNAALASVYAVTDATLRQYKEAIEQNVAPEVKEKIEETVAQKQVQAQPSAADNYIYNINPDGILFVEPVTWQQFRSDKETIRAAANDIKQDMLHDGFDGTATLGDFFDKLGLKGNATIKEQIGWSISYNCLDSISFKPIVAPCGLPALLLEYKETPKRDYAGPSYTRDE